MTDFVKSVVPEVGVNIDLATDSDVDGLFTTDSDVDGLFATE